jgi:hypothetical protein
MEPNLILAKERIVSADVSSVIKRLVQVEKWSEKDALAACQYYRNYLYILLKYSHQYELPPSLEIDEMWHAHILHTHDYQQFCQLVFNNFLHHQPYDAYGELAQMANELFESQTQRLHYEEFGDYIYAIRPIPIRLYVKRFLRELKSMLWTKKALTVKESIMDTSC